MNAATSCASCGYENPEGAKFCEECGTKLVRVCASCGHELRPTAKFCGNCGAALTEHEQGEKAVLSSQLSVVSPQHPTPNTQPPAERRQLTVMFCDLVGSTALSEQLDPEDYREVIQAYNEVCATIIKRFDGHLAKYLGDGLLVYFGYPVAHEDDAQRAVRAGLEIITAIQQQVPSLLRGEGQGEGAAIADCGMPIVEEKSQRYSSSIPHSALAIPQSHTAHPNPPSTPFKKGLPQGTGGLKVRIGIHTGLVVAGEMGAGDTREPLAIVGETPNLAARLQGLAEPNTVVISSATQRLVKGFFTLHDRGAQAVKGLSAPVIVYEVQGESSIQSRFELAVTTGLTPLVGREEEVRLLEKRWERVKEGEGQVVVLQGEAGIGKSRLIAALKEHVAQDGALHIELRCSPYHQNSALHPIIDHLQRILQFGRDDSPEEKLRKLENAHAEATGRSLLQPDTIPLLAAFLSLPHPESYPPLTLSPQKQKQKTQEVLIAWLMNEAEQHAVYCVWEDLHWADPSTLELLDLLLDQVPTTRLLTLFTFRPEFIPPWRPRTHITQLMLNRLGHRDVEEMITKITGGTSLPAEVRQQIVSKTDGIPLFVEEVTKTVIEAQREQVTGDGGQEEKVVGAQHAAPTLPLGIPATLQDALMARLDRLGEAKEVAQLGATLGREFSYGLLQAVTTLEESALQQALQKLVDSELLYQRGLPPHAIYTFKHALIQDTAHQSLLKSTRQQYHSQIAQVLEERFPETKEIQPELLAHHYTEAGLIAQAISYWQKAGQRAVQRSANIEAIQHLTKGLQLLKTLPETPERAQQELVLQITLGVPLIAAKGWAAVETGTAFGRARDLCQQIGETPHLFPVLFGLWLFYTARAEHKRARELGEQCLTLAQRAQNSDFYLESYAALEANLFHLGELASSRKLFKQALILYDSRQHRSHGFLYGQDPGVASLVFAAWASWALGYPEQALQRGQEALSLAREVAHPFSLGFALFFAAATHQFRREAQATQECAEAAVAFGTDQGFPEWVALGALLRGWALVEQEQEAEGIAQLQKGLAAHRTAGAEVSRTYYLGLVAQAYGRVEQAEEGLKVLTEALAFVGKSEERYYEAELYRLKGELLLQQFKVQGSKPVLSLVEGFKVTDPRPLTPDPQSEAEACFLKAIDIARKQQAKSWELRASTSLARLWQQQGKTKEAHELLSTVYNWFTEGFATKDLQEAKALLEELSD